jgi:glycosyltransferase involved in cell wall biosynthesis
MWAAGRAVEAVAGLIAGLPAMRIAMLSPGWPPGLVPNGIVTAVGYQLEALQCCDASAVVLTWNDASPVKDARIVIVPPDVRSASHVARVIGDSLAPAATMRQRTAGRIAAAVASLKEGGPIDVIDLEESFGWAAPLCERTQAAIVVTLHGPWFIHGALFGQGSRHRPFRERVRAEGEALRSASLLIAPAHDVIARANRYYGLSGVEAAVVPYAIRAVPRDQRWTLQGCDPAQFLFVGRFDRHKGGDLVIDAMARVRRAARQAKLVFVGPDRGLVDDVGRSWSLEHYVEARLPGALESGSVVIRGQLSREEIHRHRLGSLATVSASRWENLSLAALEAMACGCPLIAADQGGLRDHVRLGENGVLFQAGDSGALADAMLSLLRDASMASRLGSSAVAYVEEHLSPEVIGPRRLDAYARALDIKKSKARI